MYLFGENTPDEILFPMVQDKNDVVSSTLDGVRSEYKIKKLREKKKKVIEPEIEKDCDGFDNNLNEISEGD